MQALALRLMKGDAEVQFCVEMARQEGWNPGLSDASAFLATDSEGYIVAESKSPNPGTVPIGCISCVQYPLTTTDGRPFRYCFLGFFIVAQEHRRKGIGAALWNGALEHGRQRDGGSDVVFGLDAVVEQRDRYAKSGFEVAFSSVRYELRVTSTTVIERDDASASGVSRLSADDAAVFDQLVAYDAAVFGCGRRSFLLPWVKNNACFIHRANDGNIEGYIVIRECFRGFKVGPLFADGLPTAEALFGAAVDLVKDSKAKELSGGSSTIPVYLDCIDTDKNPHSHHLPDTYGMGEVFRTSRMYLKPQHSDGSEVSHLNGGLNKWYGLTTTTLG